MNIACIYYVVMVKRSALQLYYKLLKFTPSFRPFFFSISLSMFEITSHTDNVILKNMKEFLFDTIESWLRNPENEMGWELLEYFNSANVNVLEVSDDIMI